jgi:hypothetical protein
MKKYITITALSFLLAISISPAEAWLSGEVNDALYGRNHSSSPGSMISTLVGIGFIALLVYSRFRKDDDE